ncbi:MAG: RluA family pseudouridine synthase [Saprospiraceae bacterium]|nr:RluA family pseudouridine synthase [Saprospiraceae bacterium]
MPLHHVPDLPHPIRLQEYGVGIFEQAPTKSAWKKVIKKNLVQVDGKVGTTGTFINGGETIELQLPAESMTLKRLVLPLEVLFEDDYLAAINKPAGILVSGNGFVTITRGLPQNLKKSLHIDACRPQPVHRLDYATTGVLLAGKTREGIRLLNQMFEEKTIHKTYLAIAIGPMPQEGVIDTPIDEKESLSHFKILATVASPRFEYLNLVKVEPKTGRRHQIRKHLASIGHPILGDKDYGLEGKILNGKGLYLHAFKISLVHPFTEENLQIEAPIPNKFGKIFNLDEIQF